MSYAHLERKSKNLRDQASSLKKLQGCVMDGYREDAGAANADGGEQCALSAATVFDYSQKSFEEEDQNTRDASSTQCKS